MPMPCADENTLLDYLQGRLPVDDARDIDDHVDGCSSCHALLAALGRALTAGDRDGAVDRGASDVAPVRVGDRLGRYVVLEWLGAGGMGVVYSAYDNELDRKVALKVMRPASAARGSEARDAADERERSDRMLREARALAQIAHPNVVGVYDVGTVGGQVFVTMEFVHGKTLRAWLDEAPRPWTEVLARFVEAGRGLAAVHAAELVHRDVKPENVLLGDDGRVRVGDFGLAAPAAATSEGGARFVGTPAYAAPEQLTGEATSRSDQFAFAVSLFEALYGEAPFAMERGRPAYDAPRSPPAGSLVPASVRTALARALSRDPAARFATMDELLEALRVDDPAAAYARRRRVWLGAALVLLAAAPLGWLRYERAARPAVCSGGEDRLAGVWDEPTKAAVRDGLLATKSPLAADAWQFAERGLDDYAHRWVSAWTDACTATRVRGEQSEALLDRRVECLDDRLAEMKSLAGLLAHADEATVRQAAQATRSLSHLEDCANVRALASPIEPPRDAATATEVARLRASLADAKARRDAGRYAEALATTSDVVTRAHALAYRPLDAEALLLRGELEGKVKDRKTAEATLYDALAAAEAGRHDECAARVLVKLVYTVGVRGARYDEAHRLDALAHAVVERLGRADDVEGRRLGAIGLVLGDEHRWSEAVDAETRSVALLEGVHGRDDYDVAISMQYLGEALHGAGRVADATAQLEQAEATLERLVGANHPAVAGVLDDIGSMLRAQRRFDEAIAHHRRALGIAETMVGPESSDVGYASTSLGEDLAAVGRWEEARAAFERALAIQTAHGAPAEEIARTRSALEAARAPTVR